MKKLLFLTGILLIFFTISCKKKYVGYNISALVRIKYIDKDSTNLLENNTYNFDNINLYYLIDGKKEKFYHSNLDDPKGIKLDTLNGEIYLGVFLNLGTNDYGLDADVFSVFDRPDGDFKTTTYIELSKTETDTIVAKFYKVESSIGLTELWYNGNHFVLGGDNLNSTISIVK